MPHKIVVTSGEPAGIGPDLVVLISQQAMADCLFVLGCPELLMQRARLLNLHVQLKIITLEQVKSIDNPAEAGSLYVIAHSITSEVIPGQLNKANAHYVLNLLNTAISACQQGIVDALVTAPVQKSVINDAGINFSGHTEYLAQKTQTDQVVMMLASETMKVALATTHLPLRDVANAINQRHLARTCQIVHQALNNEFGIAHPHILVAGLNPHAGESGHLGTEEIHIISPAIQQLQSQGLDFVGPLPADTLFTPKFLDKADAVIAMYHDQGLPVLKYASFGAAANITLGLPIIRTSVDHGTALDLAGTGKINPQSLLVAIQFATKMVNKRK